MSSISVDDPSETISEKLRILRKKRTRRRDMSPVFSMPTRATNNVPKVAWSDWVLHLTQRRLLSDSNLPLLDSKKPSPLLWAWSKDKTSVSSVRFVEKMCRGCRAKPERIGKMADEIESWLARSKDRCPEPGFGVECLAMVRAMPTLASGIGEELWWDLLSSLAESATDAMALSLEEEPLSHQLLAGELALTIAFVFPEIKFQNDPVRQARVEISRGIINHLDGEGMLHARHIQWLRLLMACWTRSYIMSAAMRKHVINRDARTQYEWLVRQSLRLTRADGRQILSSEKSEVFNQQLLQAALYLSKDPIDDAIANVVTPQLTTTRSDAGPKIGRTEPFLHSEWAEVSFLRRSWERKSERFTLTHTNRELLGELENNGDLLLTGNMDPVFTVDGTPVRRDEDWEVVCWFTDSDGDYVEIECACDGGWTIQRQVFLGREERFLFLADLILGPGPAKLRYQCDFPIGHGISVQAAEETNECFFINRKNRPRAVCLPLALSEWRLNSRVGTLMVENGRLRLQQQSSGSRGLYAPMFIYLDTRRMRKSLTWRQLTVGERLETVPWDVAAGYRIQFGKKQWLIYRSLAERGNRTVLGQNLTAECLIGRFKRDGTVETLVEIE